MVPSYLLEDRQERILANYRTFLVRLVKQCNRNHVTVFFMIDEQADRLDKAGISDLMNKHMRSYLMEIVSMVKEDQPNFPCQTIVRSDLPPMLVPPVMLVRQARRQGRQARGPQAPAAGSPESCAVFLRL